jgi:hypothetical protein
MQTVLSQSSMLLFFSPIIGRQGIVDVLKPIMAKSAKSNRRFSNKGSLL